jgi:hypothetical protein
VKQLGREVYVLNSGRQRRCCFPCVDFRSVSGFRLCVSFLCGPKTLCDLREAAANLDPLTRPGHLTSKSASVLASRPAGHSASTILSRDKIMSYLSWRLRMQVLECTLVL